MVSTYQECKDIAESLFWVTYNNTMDEDTIAEQVLRKTGK